ncbi:MAG TPA: flagellar FlbD family protein [Polyangiaceae bacterium]|nr:flagellar FlbD family protein [Polyangiaceae bacterium]
MVTLSRLNGSVVAINPDLITWIDVTPDTIVSLLGGDKIIVREPLEEVIELIVAFRRSVGPAYTGSKEGAVTYLDIHRAELHSGRQRTGRSTPPPPRGSIPPEGK